MGAQPSPEETKAAAPSKVSGPPAIQVSTGQPRIQTLKRGNPPPPPGESGPGPIRCAHVPACVLKTPGRGGQTAGGLASRTRGLGVTESGPTGAGSPEVTQSSPVILPTSPFYSCGGRRATCPRSQLFSDKRGLPSHLHSGTPNSRAFGVRHVTEMRGDQRGSAVWEERPPRHPRV